MEEVGRRPPGSFLRMVKKPRSTLPRVSPVSWNRAERHHPRAALLCSFQAGCLHTEVLTQNLSARNRERQTSKPCASQHLEGSFSCNCNCP